MTLPQVPPPNICRYCDKDIRLGVVPGGAWFALESDATPGGDFAFVPLRRRRPCILTVRHAPRYDDLPLRTKALIRPDMREFWRATLDGPRFRRHRHSRHPSLIRVDRLLEDWYTEHVRPGLHPHLLDGDIPFLD